MTIASRRAIQIAGPDKKDEEIVTFRKEPDGTYTKLTAYVERDYKTGIAKTTNKNVIETGPYNLVKEVDGYDEKMEYFDMDGSKKYMFLKIINENIDD